jgi:hypothetical protein
MTEIAAIMNYFSQFATTYASDNVPTNAQYPYLTVEPRIAFFDDGDVPVQVQLWHRTDSDAAVNKIVRDIGRDIGYGGMPVPCDGGWVWIKKGSPFCVPVTIETDEAIKRRLINVSIEYMTD